LWLGKNGTARLVEVRGIPPLPQKQKRGKDGGTKLWYGFVPQILSTRLKRGGTLR
jgi:hypothetical protein